MPSCSKNEVVLVRFPFSGLTVSGEMVRPAVVVGALGGMPDVFLAPLTSKVSVLLPGEFVLADWGGAGLNVKSAVKRGIYTVHESSVIQKVGKLSGADAERLEGSVRQWLDLH